MYRALVPKGEVCILTYGTGIMNVTVIADSLIHTEKWASFIRRIFELYALGSYPLLTLAKEMEEQGWTNGNGKAMNTSQLDRFLDNPFYYGMMQVKGKLCTNGKGICKKEWVREEELLSPMLEYLDKIKVSDDLIEKIVDYLKKSFGAEQEFYKQTHENLRKELDQVQNRISRLVDSRLVDSHLDGKIDGDIYEQKLNEYKKRQQEIVSLMATHVDADKASLITVKMVLDLAKRAKQIYESSKVEEKRQILNFLFSNLEMRDKKAIITLREPFDKLVAVSDRPMYRRRWDSNPRYVFTHTRFPSVLHRPLGHSSVEIAQGYITWSKNLYLGKMFTMER